MSVPVLVVLGRRIRPLLGVVEAGELLGLSRGQSFRAAADWPTVGERGARRVIMPVLLGRLGIAFEVEKPLCEESRPASASFQPAQR